MKIGDLVRRKKPLTPPSHGMHVADTTRLGIVMGLRKGGNGPRTGYTAVVLQLPVHRLDARMMTVLTFAGQGHWKMSSCEVVS